MLNIIKGCAALLAVPVLAGMLGALIGAVAGSTAIGGYIGAGIGLIFIAILYKVMVKS